MVETYRYKPCCSESGPVDLVAVEINQGPDPKCFGPSSTAMAGAWRGMGDVTDHAQIRRCPLFGDLTIDLVYVLDPLVRLLHQVHVVLAGTSDLARLALNSWTQPLNHCLVPRLDGEKVVTDSTHHSMIDSVGVCIGTKNDNLLTGLPASLVR